MLVEVLPKDWAELPSHKISANERDIVGAVKKAVQHMHGDFGLGVTRASLVVKFFNPHTGVFLLRVRRGPHVLVSSVLPLVDSINCQPVTLQMLKLCGTIRSCFKYLKAYDCKVMLDVLSRCATGREKQLAKAKIAEVYAMLQKEVCYT